MILIGIDCTEQYEAMKRGEWPEPHPEVLAAQRALRALIEVVDHEEIDDRDDRQDRDDE